MSESTDPQTQVTPWGVVNTLIHSGCSSTVAPFQVRRRRPGPQIGSLGAVFDLADGQDLDGHGHVADMAARRGVVEFPEHLAGHLPSPEPLAELGDVDEDREGEAEGDAEEE